MKNSNLAQNSVKLFLISLLLIGCTTERSPVTGEKEHYGFSWEQEKQLGAESDHQISRQLGLYEDESVQRYVTEIGQGVLASSDFADAELPERYRDTEFTFRVLDSPVVNAFALPGGYVYVTRGLLAYMENEAQLAVVLGHEIGHVAGRHSAQRALKSQWSQLGLMAGVILGREALGDDYTRDIFGVGGTVLQLLLNKYSREHEREADRLGVEYAARKGYEASEGAEFFRTLDRMAQVSGSRVPSWQSTHPDPAEREEFIIEMARRLGAEYPMEKINTETYNQVINGMVFGEDPREGYVESGTFFHPDLRFRIDPPANWQVQNETQAVLMVDQPKQTVLILEITPADSIHAAVQALAQGEGVEILRDYTLRSNDLPARVVEAKAQTQNGPIALMNVFIEYDGRVYSLMGYTQTGSMDVVRDPLLTSARSFGPVSNPRYLNVEPARMNVFRSNRSTPFQNFVPSDLPQNMDPTDIAILNHVDLDDVVQRGSWLKIPRS